MDEAERYSESYVSYDDESRVVKDAIYLTYNFGTAQAPETLKASVIREYSYDEDGRLSASSMGGISIDYTYDELDRITNQSFSIYGDVYRTTEYVYEAGSIGKIEKYISTVGEGASAVVSEYIISYDTKGFITEIIQPDGKKISYEYDIIGQLTREVNEPLGKRFDYSYDNSGNITGKITRSLSNGTVLTEESFGYTDTAWGDLRTKYNGYEYYISYDEIGNPTGYYAGKDRYIIDWEGRLPVHMYKEQASISFTYNVDGLRTSKTVDGVKHEYELCGAEIISEKWGDKLLVYIYDANGAPIGMRYIDTSISSTFETYWFEKNFLGDIVAVYDEDGVKQVSYVYDAWGNQTVTTHVAGSAAQYNPFRYRGYYYDADLEFYYLQTRYYDSAVGRFINADTFVSTGQGLTACNMFAYCGNNPVNRIDPTGEWWWDTLFDAISLVFSIVDVIRDPTNWENWVNLGLDIAFTVTPFVSSGISKVSKAVSKVDDGIDAGKAVGQVISQIDNGIDASKALAKVDDAIDAAQGVKKGWKVGDDFRNLTAAGNIPSWSTVRQRYWKNEAFYSPSAYSTTDLDRMKKGLAPRCDDGFSMELHHPFGRRGDNFFIFEPLSRTEHMRIHNDWK